MKGYIKEEFKRAIFSRNTLIAVVLCFICITLNFTYTNKGFYIRNKNAATTFLLIFRGKYSILLLTFASLIASLPYAASYAIDAKNGFVKDVYTRMSRKKYFLVKYFVNGIVGGAVLALCLLITLAILLIIFRGSPIKPFTGQDIFTGAFEYFYNNNLLIYSFICILMLFGYGFIFSTLGLSIAVLTENMYLSLFFPLLFPIIITMLFGGGEIGHYLSVEMIFYPMNFAYSTEGQFFIAEGIWLSFVTILYFIGSVRKVIINE